MVPSFRCSATCGVDVRRVHPSSGELLGMWYNAHRSRDGMWVEGRRVPRNQQGRPVAYVALHGHGVYPMVRPGCKLDGHACVVF